MEARAKLTQIGVPATKVRQIIDHLRGKPVEEALGLLRFSRRPVAKVIEKVLRSAIANCQNVKSGTGTETSVDAEKLVVKTIFADEGRDLKRVRPRARGSADRIVKRHSHVTVVVSDETS